MAGAAAGGGLCRPGWAAAAGPVASACRPDGPATDDAASLSAAAGVGWWTSPAPEETRDAITSGREDRPATARAPGVDAGLAASRAVAGPGTVTIADSSRNNGARRCGNPGNALTRTGPAMQDETIVAQFDTLAAADALEDAGIDRTHTKAIATQLRVASDAGEPVTRPALDVALGALKAELIERIAETEKRMLQHSAEMERRLMDRTPALIWRLFGAMVALAGITIAVLEYLRTPAG